MAKPEQPSIPEMQPSSTVFASDQEVETAATACEAALRRGAEPLSISDEAIAVLRARYKVAFRDSLPRVGGWLNMRAQKVLLQVAFYLGVIARDIATFHESPRIEVNHVRSAGKAMEGECDLAAGSSAEGREGLVCSDLAAWES